MAPIAFKTNKTHGQSLLGLGVLDIVRSVPQGLKPGNICGGYGTAEGVPSMDDAAMKKNMQRQKRTQIPFGNDNK